MVVALRRFIIVDLAAGALLMPSAVARSASTLTVCASGCDYTTIAVNAASDGRPLPTLADQCKNARETIVRRLLVVGAVALRKGVR